MNYLYLCIECAFFLLRCLQVIRILYLSVRSLNLRIKNWRKFICKNIGLSGRIAIAARNGSSVENNQICLRSAKFAESFFRLNWRTYNRTNNQEHMQTNIRYLKCVNFHEAKFKSNEKYLQKFTNFSPHRVILS